MIVALGASTGGPGALVHGARRAILLLVTLPMILLFGLIVLLISAVAFLAAWLPDRRATLAQVCRIDDVVLLRYALSSRFRMD